MRTIFLRPALTVVELSFVYPRVVLLRFVLCHPDPDRPRPVIPASGDGEDDWSVNIVSGAHRNFRAGKWDVPGTRKL